MPFFRHFERLVYHSHGQNYLAGLADKYVAKLQIFCQIRHLYFEQDISKNHPAFCQIII